jgi:serine phosphatase RsbU (regulator of sigma subunit)
VSFSPLPELKRRRTHSLPPAPAKRLPTKCRPIHPVDCFQVAWSNTPLQEVGGDLVLTAAPAPGRLFLFVADAVGHGPAAAALAGSLRAAVATCQRAGVWEPGDLLGCLNTACLRFGEGKFATAAACLLDNSAGMLRYALAGHPPILLRHPAGVTALSLPSLPLGIAPEATYEQGCVALPPRACALLYTDGVTDALGAAPAAAVGRLSEVFARCPCVDAEQVLRTVSAAVGTGLDTRNGIQDDCSALVALRQPRPPGGWTCWPPQPFWERASMVPPCQRPAGSYAPARTVRKEVRPGPRRSGKLINIG